MALLPCLKCDKTYGDWKENCPHCGSTNFFQQALAHRDAELLKAAVQVTIKQIGESNRLRHKSQMSELNALDPTTLVNRIKNSPPVVAIREYVL